MHTLCPGPTQYVISECQFAGGPSCFALWVKVRETLIRHAILDLERPGAAAPQCNVVLVVLVRPLPTDQLEPSYHGETDFLLTELKTCLPKAVGQARGER